MIKHSKVTLPSILEYYLAYSFWSSFLLFSFFHFIIEKSPSSQFFMICLTVMNYYFYYNGVGKTRVIYKNSAMPAYFLAQTICLIGSAVVNESLGALYLSLIPCAAGTYYFLVRDNTPQVEHLFKGINLFFIGSSFYIFLSLFYNRSLLSVTEFACFAGFVCWTGGIVFYGVRLTLKEYKHNLIQLLRRAKNENHVITEENKKRFFFHDLINTTHGIGLFLNHALKNDQVLTMQEIESLKDEIHTMESMIQDHFDLKHKNLMHHEPIIPFKQAKVKIMSLIKNYLPPEKVDCHFIFNGYLKYGVSLEEEGKALVHLSSLTRIIGNIVKNMAESGTKEAEFRFDYREDGFHLLTRNKIYQLKDDRQNLADKMKELILKDQTHTKDPLEGVGLLSTQAQVKSLGGEFQFKIENGYWTSEIFLPVIHLKEREEKLAA